VQVHMQQQAGRALFKARRLGLKMPGPAWPGPFRTLFSLPSRSLYIPNYDKNKSAAVTTQVGSCVGLCRFPTRIKRIRVWCRLTVALFHLIMLKCESGNPIQKPSSHIRSLHFRPTYTDSTLPLLVLA